MNSYYYLTDQNARATVSFSKKLEFRKSDMHFCIRDKPFLNYEPFNSPCIALFYVDTSSVLFSVTERDLYENRIIIHLTSYLI